MKATLPRIFNFRLIPHLFLMFVCGILIATIPNSIIKIIICLIPLGIFVYLYIKSRSYIKSKRGKLINVLILSFVMMILGGVLCEIALNNNFITAENADIVVRVTDSINNTDNEIIAIVDDIVVNGDKIKGKSQIIIPNSMITGVELECGDIITMKGDIIPNGIDPYDSWSTSNYINKQYYNIEVISLENREQGKLLLDEEFRESVYYSLSSINISEATKGMAYALITASKGIMNYDVRNVLSEAGIAHVFVVSGMHVAILCGFIFWLLSKINMNKYFRVLVTSILLMIYAYLCGFTPSVNRAILISIFVMLGIVGGKYNDMISLLALSAIILLIINPIYIFNISFQMSYLAVLGILCLYKKIFDILPFPKIINSIVATSISANLALFPLLIVYFGEISLYFLIVNIIILPFVPIIYITLLITVSISIIMPIISSIIWVGVIGLSGIYEICKLIVSLPYSVLEINLSALFMVPYYAILCICSKYSLLNRKNKVTAYIVMGILLIVTISVDILVLH